MDELNEYKTAMLCTSKYYHVYILLYNILVYLDTGPQKIYDEILKFDGFVRQKFSSSERILSIQLYFCVRHCQYKRSV